MRILLLIVFGALGTLARYGLQGLVQYRTGSAFPTGTLAVNLLGCFLLGGIAQYALQRLSIKFFRFPRRALGRLLARQPA